MGFRVLEVSRVLGEWKFVCVCVFVLRVVRMFRVRVRVWEVRSCSCYGLEEVFVLGGLGFRD